MDPLMILLFLICDVFYMFAIKKFMNVFFEKRRTSLPIMWSAYLSYGLLITVRRFLFNNMIAHMIVALPILFVITLNYESSMLKRLVAAVSNYTVFLAAIMAAGLLGWLISLIFPMTDEYFSIFEYMIGGILSILAALFLNRFKGIRRNNAAMPLLWGSALFLTGSTLVMMIFALLSLQIPYTISLILFLIGVNVLIFYLYDALSVAYKEKINSVLHSQEKEYYLSQCQLMQESVEKMKAYRHDVKNHLSTLKECSIGNETATDYLNTLLGEIEKSEIHSDTGNIAFDSIINYKLRNARQDNIELDLRISVPLTLRVDVVDIVTILGNLLDNALEAVAKVHEKSIKLDIEFGKGSLFIKIDNSFDGEVRYSEETVGEERQMVSLKEGDEHGYGLKNIRQSLEKYNGYMKITHTENVFSVRVLLYVEDMQCKGIA